MMETMVFGPFQALALFLAASGNISTDLVSFIDEQSYFKNKGIAIDVDKMVDLAGKGRTSGPAPIAQLLAIRWLGEHKDEASQGKKTRETLMAAAGGKAGNDGQGFAAEYARRALARLDGKPFTVALMPAGSLRSEGLRWFPEKSTIFGGIELRPTEEMRKDAKAEASVALRKAVAKGFGPAAQMLHQFADKAGNFRIDRISLAVIPDVQDDRLNKVFVRISGKASRKALSGYLAEQVKRAVVTERKGPDGEPMTIVDLKNDGPALAFLGDDDLVVGFRTGGPNANNVDVLEECLAVAAGKKRGILKGPYANVLKNSAPQALALLVGDLPERWRKDMTRGGSPFQGVPEKINLTWTFKAKALKMRFTGAAATAKEAKDFVAGINTLTQLASAGLKSHSILLLKLGKPQLASAGLKNLPQAIKANPKGDEALQAALKTVKLEAKDTALSGSAAISVAGVEALGELMRFYFFLAQPPQPAPRPVKR